MNAVGYSPIKNQLVNLLEQNAGSNIANLYRNFYADKDIKTVLLSVSELLTEFLGQEKKDQVLKDFMTRNQITLPQ